MASPLSTQVSDTVSTTIWGVLSGCVLEHWIVLTAFVLVMVVAVIYVLMKD